MLSEQKKHRLCLENPLCHSYLALKLKCYRSPSLLVPFKIFFLLHFFSYLTFLCLWCEVSWNEGSPLMKCSTFQRQSFQCSTLLNILVLYKKEFAKTSSVSRGIVHEFLYWRDRNPFLSTVSSISISRNSSDKTSTDSKTKISRIFWWFFLYKSRSTQIEINVWDGILYISQFFSTFHFP